MLEIPNLKLAVSQKELRGLPWIFSNQVFHLEDSLLDSAKTALVRIPELGCVGVYSKSNLISVRLLPESFSVAMFPHANLSPGRLEELLELHIRRLFSCKNRVFPFTRNQCFRLVHGDADGLPGIVVDHYQSFITMQVSSSCGEYLASYVAEALQKIFECPLLERSTGQARAMEGLPERTRWIRGKVERAFVQFAGLELEFEPLRAQKTGLFLDQRKNLEFLTSFLSHEDLKPKNMLDICSYAGAWSSAGASAGIGNFTIVDADAQALKMAVDNIGANSPDARALGNEPTVEKRHGDLFEELSKLKSQGRQFDVVVADPPAFAKSKKHVVEASKAYGRLIKIAAQLTSPDGLLVVCSCSKNIDHQMFWDICSRHLSREWIMIHKGEQSPDHTIGMSQSAIEYLKCLFFQKRQINC